MWQKKSSNSLTQFTKISILMVDLRYYPWDKLIVTLLFVRIINLQKFSSRCYALYYIKSRFEVLLRMR